jgi:hypothetical protein
MHEAALLALVVQRDYLAEATLYLIWESHDWGLTAWRRRLLPSRNLNTHAETLVVTDHKKTEKV